MTSGDGQRSLSTLNSGSTEEAHGASALQRWRGELQGMTKMAATTEDEEEGEARIHSEFVTP